MQLNGLDIDWVGLVPKWGTVEHDHFLGKVVNFPVPNFHTKSARCWGLGILPWLSSGGNLAWPPRWLFLGFERPLRKTPWFQPINPLNQPPDITWHGLTSTFRGPLDHFRLSLFGLTSAGRHIASLFFLGTENSVAAYRFGSGHAGPAMREVWPLYDTGAASEGWVEKAPLCFVCQEWWCCLEWVDLNVRAKVLYPKSGISSFSPFILPFTLGLYPSFGQTYDISHGWFYPIISN